MRVLRRALEARAAHAPPAPWPLGYMAALCFRDLARSRATSFGVGIALGLALGVAV